MSTYTPFEINYTPLSVANPSVPYVEADSLILLLFSSANTTPQQGSALFLDHLQLWAGEAPQPDTCSAIFNLTVDDVDTTILLTVFSVVIAVLGFAQPKIQFDQTTYDFGMIREEGGKVTARFNFTNVGTEDLILKSVRPGCGCTAANYTKTAIAPGERGYIDATYNPSGRPGSFNKNIKVTTNEPEMDVEKPTPHMIFIKGNVSPKPKSVFEKEGYTMGQGMVRIKTNTAKLEVLNTQQHLDTFQIKNFGTKPVKVTLNNNGFVSEAYRSFGPEIQGGEEGIVVLKYDAAKRNDFGTLKDAI